MIRAVVFDVDGTLTASTGLDDACLAAAWERVLGPGMRGVSTDWTTYEHSTDEGLTIEACERALGRCPTRGEVEAVKREFFGFLRERIARDGGCCRMVPGARELVGALEGAGWRVGIASGAWEESARIKLEAAGVVGEWGAWPGTFSHAKADGRPAVREEIVRGTIRRLFTPETTESTEEGRVAYVGDGPWDARAARALGVGFVGVRVDGRHEHMQRERVRAVVRDFVDVRRVMELIEREARTYADRAR